MATEAMQSAQMQSRQLEMAVALQQGFLAAAVRLAGRSLRADAADGFLFDSDGPSRIFRGTADQVAAVRQFVRAEAGEHAALDDAVLVASELAANAIAHTASGRDCGLFMVHLTAVTTGHIAILVTDQGSHTAPEPQHASADAETGRGLDAVTALASVFVAFGGSSTRAILAVVGGKDSDH
jgi:anti-sigma regulatory factor (Ser/Thr protein kinase)